MLSQFPNAVWNEIFFQGAYAASEFLTYDVKKIYVVKSVVFGKPTQGTTIQQLSFYNEANAILGGFGDVKPVWNTTAAALNYINGLSEIKDLYFSRILATQIDYIKIIGYKLTLP